MPLSEHEQRILDEIEKRPRARRIRVWSNRSAAPTSTRISRAASVWPRLAFVAGLLLMLCCSSCRCGSRRSASSMMVLSALLIYRYLGQLGRDQIREMQTSGRLTLAGVLGRIAARFGDVSAARDDPRG